MKTTLSIYTYKLPQYILYMLQQVEYNPKKFIKWLQHVFDENKKIATVMQRKRLVYTPKAIALMVCLYVLATLIIASPFFFYESALLIGINTLIFFVALPFIIFLFAVVFTLIARVLLVAPKERKMIKNSKNVFSKHTGIKIAVLGSYGKTSMKEMLAMLLAEGKKVAVTPGNMNTAVSHARFASELKGDEDIVIVEFGEGAPGDISLMAGTLQPDYAIITGLAPNHLDFYSSLEGVAVDLLSIYEYVDSDKVFVNGESELLKKYLSKKSVVFSNSGVLGWKVSDTIISVLETSFTMKKERKELHITTGLVGRHQVAPTALVVAMAVLMGINEKQIIKACLKLRPYEHRMQPRMMHSAWLIDDTYNGNIEGMKAGLKLLGELDMKRKWYVTPGLVDQGLETENVHIELGKTIAAVHPDVVVLMENSVTPIIQKSMKKSGFSGELRIEKNPLEFYTNIEHVIISGDLVLMQNDWTDNYN
jgi:UDP-N-acetylmuramoyl-tripeptide--D-alanyl-D-alanine ligase